MAKKKAARAAAGSPLGEDLSARLVLQSTALAAAGNGVVITDRSGAILWVNPAFTTLSGYGAEEVQGANLRILKSGRQDAAFYREFWQTIAAGRVWRGEFINRRKDGRIYINEETITPVRLNGGEITHFVGVMQDVTERKQAEADVRALNEQLEHRVKQRTAELEGANQELEAFAYSVSHDLRAPLRHIDGFLNLLLASPASALADQDRHYLNLIAKSAKAMDRLIDDLLLFSRMAQGALTRTDVPLGALVEKALARLAPEINGRAFVWQITGLPTVRADAAMLQQVLLNLLSNAIKYTGPRDPARIEVFARRHKHETVVGIRDNGVGFDMRYMDKLFGVFQRLHSRAQFEGNGIGLANVRRIILRHGGRTWAEGRPDEGAVFYFSLPNA